MILWIVYPDKVQRAELDYIDSECCDFRMKLMSTLELVTIEPRFIRGIEIKPDFNIMFDFEGAIEQTDTIGEIGVFWLRRGGTAKLDERVRIISEGGNDRNLVLVRTLKDRKVRLVHVDEFGGIELDEQVIIHFKNATRREA